MSDTSKDDLSEMLDRLDEAMSRRIEGGTSHMAKALAARYPACRCVSEVVLPLRRDAAGRLMRSQGFLNFHEKGHVMDLDSIERRGRSFIAELLGDVASSVGGRIEREQLDQLARDVAMQYREWCEVLASHGSAVGREDKRDPDSSSAKGSFLVSRVIRQTVLGCLPSIATGAEIEADLWRYVGSYIEGCKALSLVSDSSSAS